MTQYQYCVVLIPQEEGGYTVTVPALPGCISEGDTKREALKNIKDAIEGYLLVVRKRGLPFFSGVQEIEAVTVVAGVLKDA
ncbi:type II toxin-antitoxin system HicB family antitoxin [Candidatus Parcubacteria bacterium]|nr:type II toxin-antitoxin system HicB family antitoxin [Candidatus Parcubacteria bacterium]